MRHLLVACCLFLHFLTADIFAASTDFLPSAASACGRQAPGAAEVTGEAGDYVILPCCISGLTRDQEEHLSWYGPHLVDIPLTVGGMKFTSDRRFSLERRPVGHQQEFNLVISFVSPADVGLYRCRYGKPAKEQTVYLKVNTAPTIIQHKSKMTTTVPEVVRLGDNVTLKCSTWLSNQQDVDLDWVKLGPWPGAERTRPTKRLRTWPEPGRSWGLRRQLTAMLAIPLVTLSDAGVYECRRSLIGRSRGEADVARVTVKIRFSRKQHLYFLSTTTVEPGATTAAASWSSNARHWQRYSNRFEGGDGSIQSPNTGGGGLPKSSNYDGNGVLSDGLSPVNQWKSPDDSWGRRTNSAAAATAAAGLAGQPLVSCTSWLLLAAGSLALRACLLASLSAVRC